MHNEEKRKILYTNDGKGKYQSHEIDIITSDTFKNDKYINSNIVFEEELTGTCYGESLEEATMNMYEQLIAVRKEISSMIDDIENGNVEFINKYSNQVYEKSYNTDYYTGDKTCIPIKDIINKVITNIKNIKERCNCN